MQEAYFFSPKISDAVWRSRADKIQRANLDGSNIETLVIGLGSPRGIGLDLTAGKMYKTYEVWFSESFDAPPFDPTKLFRTTVDLVNMLISKVLAWLRGRDLNPRPLGYENKNAAFSLVLTQLSEFVSFLKTGI